MENNNIGDILFDEESNDNIILYGDNGEEIEFEQIATIALEENGTVYCMLHPVKPMDGMAEDEAIVMELSEDLDSGDDVLVMVDNEEILDKVWEEYYKLCRENGIEVPEE